MEHTCDAKGRPEKVVDESGDEPLTGIYPTCSVCGKPQVFEELLAKVRGVDIGAARNSLPACHRDSPDTLTAGVETPDHGLVLVTFEKLRMQHRKNVRWAWAPVSARRGLVDLP